MQKTTIWFIVGLIVLVTAAVIVAGAYSGAGPSPASPGFTATMAPAITAADWSEGNPNAPVSLIEYGDFECPACAQYNPIVHQLVQNYSSTVRFVFRNYPLYTIHPFASVSAQAAEAAGLEGGPAKYWAMHDLLYTKQQEWSTNSGISPEQVTSQFINGYARSIGLDVAQFDADMNASSVAQKIQSDVSGGDSAQIDHTPTFFVNLKQIPNPTIMGDFETALNAAVAAASPAASSSAR